MKEEFWLKLTCDKCGCLKIRIDYPDAYFCFECNEWKEEKCSDLNCSRCQERSEKPFTEEEIEWLKTWVYINQDDFLEDHIDDLYKSLGKC